MEEIMSDTKLVIVSLDALNAKDFAVIKTLPTIGRFLTEGAYVPLVDSVYPTVTYTCHTSITTGHYPHIHKVYNNEYAQPQRPTLQDWRWYERNIKCPTLFDYARQANKTIATLLWPVMAGADVKWNVPELWSPDQSQSFLKLFWQYGSHNMVLPTLISSRLLKGKDQPYLDNFTESLALNLLKRQKPDITAIHYTELDAVRHIYGLNSPQAHKALKRLDQRVARLIAATKKAGTYDRTNFVLLGDHGTHDFTKVIEMNTYFKQEGIREAYACTCGGSCHIHLIEDVTAQRQEAIYEKLKSLVAAKDSPIKALFTKEEALNTYHLKGDFQWVLEAQNGHVFRNTTSDQVITDRQLIPNCYKGDHGYLPSHEDMHTMLFMKGPGIKKAAVLDRCCLIDEGPTFAKLMGLTMEKTEGRVLNELLK